MHRNTQAAFDLLRALTTAENFPTVSQDFVTAIENDIALKELYREQYLPAFPSLEDLRGLPANSLGGSLAAHLMQNDITLDFRGVDLSGIYDKEHSYVLYARYRSLRIHDIIHVLLNAPTTPLGEGQVAAFQAAQYASPFHALALSLTNAHIAFFNSGNLHHWLKSMNQAFAAGLRATPLYGIPWEKCFGVDVGSLRHRFEISSLN